MMSGFGNQMVALVEQDSTWRTAEGEVVVVDTMTAKHLASVLRVLVSISAELYGEWADERVAAGMTDEERVLAGIDERDPETQAFAPEHVSAWFDQLPLVTRIRALLADHNLTQRSASVPATAGAPV
jgi:hypothetical protein